MQVTTIVMAVHVHQDVQSQVNPLQAGESCVPQPPTTTAHATHKWLFRYPPPTSCQGGMRFSQTIHETTLSKSYSITSSTASPL